MRIRTQIIITAVLFALVLAGVSISAIITSIRVGRANSQQALASSIATGANDLSYLANDYVVYQESQQLERWQHRFASFSNDVDGLNVSAPDQVALVANIRANTIRLKEVFDSVASSIESSTESRQGPFDPALLRVSWSRMSVQSQGLVSDSSRLAYLLDIRVSQLERENILAIVSLIGILIAYFLVNFFIIQKRVLNSISKLKAGAAIIGGGNLDFKIEEMVKDEIGELSLAFNGMTADLKTVTASKREMEKEIEERKLAEEALKNSEEKFRSLNVNMNEGICLHELIYDETGKAVDYRILDINPTYELFTGITREQAIGKKASELYGTGAPPYFDVYTRVAATGKPESFETYFPPMQKYFNISAFSPGKGQFATVFTDITERKRVEKALKESEERFRVIASSTPDHIIVQDSNLRYTFVVNPQIGLTEKDMVGKTDYDFLGKEDADNLTKVKQQVIETGQPVHLETALTNNKREPEYFSGSYVPTFNDEGKANGLIGYFQNITTRKKAEAEISHLASFPELNPNPIIELDAYGNIMYTNPAARTRFPGILEQGSKHPFLAGFANIGDEMTSVVADINIGDFWYEQVMTYIPATRSYRIYARDITERKKAEEALRDTRNYLDNLFNYANAPIIVWNPGFKITSFNHAFERLTGRSADEVLGKTLDILFPEESRDESIQHIGEATSGERLEVEEIPIRHADGTVRILLWNSANIYAPDSKTVIATIAQGQDITERRQAEESLKRRTTELEASNRELEAFSYSVSHDLRAPLRSMEGFSNALLEDYSDKLDDQGKQYLRYVEESSELMARLIDDLLRLSRVTRSEMAFETVNLSELAENIMASLRTSEPERKAELNIAHGMTAWGDAGLLKQALENMLENAWKFTGKNDLTIIKVGITEYNGEKACFIRDNGVGFDMQYAGKLFQPFQRLHKATDFTGTGIGLATVQRIIRRHGGEVWAESKVGEGATFYFTLES